MRMLSELWSPAMSEWDGGHEHAVDDRIHTLLHRGIRGGQHITSFSLTNATGTTMDPLMQAASVFCPLILFCQRVARAYKLELVRRTINSQSHVFLRSKHSLQL